MNIVICLYLVSCNLYLVKQMLFITLYIVCLLLLPVKEHIGNINESKGVNLAKKISGFVYETPTQEIKEEEFTTEVSKLEKLKEVPRLKEKKQNEKFVVWAKKALLMDAESGKILYEDKMLESHQIASLTKMMTAIVLMDLVKDWDEKVEISQYASIAGGATVHFLYGEKFLAKDLLKAMLMNSDNTAARALAEHFGGNEEKFVELMNKKAEELNLRNTKFADAAGLNDDDRSYSCAYDVAMIGKEALKYPLILEVLQTPSHIEIVSRDEFSNVHRVGNTNKLLGQYPGILGAKTGFTYEAGYCLMMMKEGKDNKKIIGVVLDAGEYGRWTEMQKMLDWAYERYKWSVFP